MGVERRYLIMGIVNVTPDSFYDGGRFQSPGAALDRALVQADEGADWVDVGGESTRPGSLGVTVEEELSRVLPVIRGLRGARPAVRVSVDTRKAVVARAALDAGADGVNDVSALSDPAMAGVVGAAGRVLFLMHMRGTPENMQEDPRYQDVVCDVRTFLAGRARQAIEAGVSSADVWVDPGFGFGKTVEHNLTLLRGIPALCELGFPVLVGASRKSFIGRVLDLPDPNDRLEGSLAVAVLAAWGGARMLRVHDVRATRRALGIVEALRHSEGGAR
jgi:dihydropteroate synthase